MFASSFKNQCKKIHWVIYLALAVVFSQGVHLHMHDVNHAHNVAALDHNHTHQQTHVAHDGAHNGNHGDTHADIDITPEGLLKNLSFNPMLATLLVAALLFFLPHRTARTIWRREDDTPTPLRLTALRPPLRAPPSPR